jgi:hypothetical protein
MNFDVELNCLRKKLQYIVTEFLCGSPFYQAANDGATPVYIAAQSG